jgi:ferredoxin
MRIEVARNRCQGNAACVFTAPDVFALDDEDIVTVIGEFADDDQRVRNAVAECPTAALRFVTE